MSSKRRLCVAITARPSYSRIRTALTELARCPEIELQILCSGSALLDRYGRVVDLIRADGFDVVDELYTFVEGNEGLNMALTTGNTIHHTASVLRRTSPAWVMSIADRYETLGTAIAAAYVGVPLIHVQGGEVTGNIDEKVRHAVTKLADIHLVANSQAAARLIRMGERPDSVFVTGCPSIDLARQASSMPISLVQEAVVAVGVGNSIDLNQDFVVVLQHPETETYDQSYTRMRITLEAIAKIGLSALVFWPNVDAGSDATAKAIRVFRETHEFGHAHYLKNLEGRVFLRLLATARCLVGNSSVGVRECAYMGTPVVNIGQRQAGRERGPNVLDVDWDRDAIVDAVQRQLQSGRFVSSPIYGVGHSGEEIARVVCQLGETSIAKRFHET